MVVAQMLALHNAQTHNHQFEINEQQNKQIHALQQHYVL